MSKSNRIAKLGEVSAKWGVPPGWGSALVHVFKGGWYQRPFRQEDVEACRQRQRMTQDPTVAD